MRAEGKVSKVAICENCKSFVMACHVDYLDAQSEKEFTDLTNEGFTVKIETIKETQSREMSCYEDCKNGRCKSPLTPNTPQP